MGSDGVAGIRRDGGVHFKLAHQTSIKANQFKFADGGFGHNVLERIAQFHQKQHIAKILRQRNIVAPQRVGRGIVPAARPARAVVGHNQHVFIGRIGLRGPRHEINQRIGIGHIHFAQVGKFAGFDSREIIILLDEKAFGSCPIAVAIKRAIVAIHLRHNLHPIR